MARARRLAGILHHGEGCGRYPKDECNEGDLVRKVSRTRREGFAGGDEGGGGDDRSKAVLGFQGGFGDGEVRTV